MLLTTSVHHCPAMAFPRRQYLASMSRPSPPSSNTNDKSSSRLDSSRRPMPSRYGSHCHSRHQLVIQLWLTVALVGSHKGTIGSTSWFSSTSPPSNKQGANSNIINLIKLRGRLHLSSLLPSCAVSTLSARRGPHHHPTLICHRTIMTLIIVCTQQLTSLTNQPFLTALSLSLTCRFRFEGNRHCPWWNSGTSRFSKLASEPADSRGQSVVRLSSESMSGSWWSLLIHLFLPNSKSIQWLKPLIPTTRQMKRCHPYQPLRAYNGFSRWFLLLGKWQDVILANLWEHTIAPHVVSYYSPYNRMLYVPQDYMTSEPTSCPQVRHIAE